MTNEEINKAIAEHVGFKSGMKVILDFRSNIPDYCSDLNAMAEARKAAFHGLKNVTHRVNFMVWLHRITEPEAATFGNPWKLVDSTARQQAEAFLRTFGKWRE